MINVPALRAAIEASPGDVIVAEKSQLALMLAEIEMGQRARIALTNLKTHVNVAASTAGAPA